MQPGLFADALLSFGHGSLRLSVGPLPPNFDAVPEQRRNDPDRRAGCNATGRAEYSLTDDADIDGETGQKWKQRDRRSPARQRMTFGPVEITGSQLRLFRPERRRPQRIVSLSWVSSWRARRAVS